MVLAHKEVKVYLGTLDLQDLKGQKDLREYKAGKEHQVKLVQEERRENRVM